MLAGREFRDLQTVVSEILRSLKPKTTTYRHRELAVISSKCRSSHNGRHRPCLVFVTKQRCYDYNYHYYRHTSLECPAVIRQDHSIIDVVSP